MNRAIVTYAAGAHQELLDISLPGFQAFADRHGYKLIIGRKLTDWPAAWNKVAIVLDALQSFDEVLWLDADLVIVNGNDDIPINAEASFALVRHFSAMSEVPNTGVWYVRRPAELLLRKMMELEVFYNHGWWEQAALMTLMGYCVPPEGSRFNQTKCRCVRETEWTRACQFLRLEWNSHPEYRAIPKARIVHCSYPHMRQRIDVMRALVANPGYDYPRWSKDD